MMAVRHSVKAAEVRWTPTRDVAAYHRLVLILGRTIERAAAECDQGNDSDAAVS